MEPLRVLIVEGEPAWLEILEPLLDKMGGCILRETVSKPHLVKPKLFGSAFDLITVNLTLLGPGTGDTDAGQPMIELLRQMRELGPNQYSAALVVTGFPHYKHFDEIQQHRLADRVFEKRSFDGTAFLDSARRALLFSRSRRQNKINGERVVFTLRSSGETWLGCSLGGARSAEHVFGPPIAYPAKRLAEQADLVGRIFSKEIRSKEIEWLWRPTAKAVGISFHEELKREPRIAELLTSAESQVDNQHLLLLRLTSPASELRLPFELAFSSEDYLCLHHPVVRRLTGLKGDLRRRVSELGELIRQLKKAEQPFRMLIVAAQSLETPLPALAEEVELVSSLAQIELGNYLGLEVIPRVLSGPTANMMEVRKALAEGVHLFHYAGHGHFDEKLPEKSGVVLHEGENLKVLSASDLESLVTDTPPRFCFFNCCLSARTAAAPDQGDFVGLCEAVLVGGVPTVLGHRWEVLDSSSVKFARAFYSNLWRSFRFEDALLAARKAVAQGDLGRNDPCWASPILIDQSG